MKTILILLALTTCTLGEVPDYAVRVYAHHDENNRPDSIGSGSLISANLVLTASHVTRFALAGDSIEVRFNDGMRIKGNVLANDNNSDVSVILLSRHTKKKPIKVAMKFNEDEKALITTEGFGSDYEYVRQFAKYQHRVAMVSIPTLDQVWITWRPKATGDFAQIGCVSRGGDSGSPATQDGKLVGVVTTTNEKLGITTLQRIDTVRRIFPELFESIAP